MIPDKEEILSAQALLEKKKDLRKGEFLFP